METKNFFSYVLVAFLKKLKREFEGQLDKVTDNEPKCTSRLYSWNTQRYGVKGAVSSESWEENLYYSVYYKAWGECGKTRFFFSSMTSPIFSAFFLRGRLDLKSSGLFPSIGAINLTIYSPAWPAGPSLAVRRARWDDCARQHTAHTVRLLVLILFFSFLHSFIKLLNNNRITIIQ